MITGMKGAFALLVLLVVCPAVFGQTDFYEEVRQFREELNREFQDPERSPLAEKERQRFTGHHFFPANIKYRVKARFTPLEHTPFETYPTTKQRRVYFRRYGYADFELEGHPYRLTLFQNKRLLHHPKYKDYLFLPFTDLTNGVESYGGGRYLDLKIPEGDSIIIDFNKAYNPFCAYNHAYSCPLVPVENHLPCEIRAGVRWDTASGTVLKLSEYGLSLTFPGQPVYAQDSLQMDGLSARVRRFRYAGRFEKDSVFVYQFEILDFDSTCPQLTPAAQNSCFQSYLSYLLDLSHARLVSMKRTSLYGHDTYEFETVAGKSHSRWRFILVGNRGFLLSTIELAGLPSAAGARFLDSIVLK